MTPKDDDESTVYVPPATTPEPEKKPATTRCGNCSGRGFTVWGDQNVTCGVCDGTGQVEK